MFCGQSYTDLDLYHMTTCAEQIMNTGGGYQDAIGSSNNGFKLIHFSPGILPGIYCESIPIKSNIQKELKNKIIFIYTGKTRLAKDLLSSIMENYVNNDINTIQTLKNIGQTAIDMKNNLVNEDLKSFGSNMIKSFDLNIKLNKNFTNNTINNIIKFSANYLDGYMLSGAGNGGFLTFLLNDSISKEAFSNIFVSKFINSDIKIYDFNIKF